MAPKRQCIKCNKFKFLKNFPLDGRFNRVCIYCGGWRYNKNEPASDAYVLRRDYSLKRNYGITWEQYQARLESQGGLCGIPNCKNPATVVDHCHKTGRLRSLLCNSCNSALGFMAENVSRIEGLAIYARYWEDQRNS